MTSTKTNQNDNKCRIDCAKLTEGLIKKKRGSKGDVELFEDRFGVYIDEDEKHNYVKRFTWKNRNKIQVQIINYGARIVSIKVPDSKGVVDDIVLGFDSLVGYLFYEELKFGATIGRVSNTIEKATFAVDGKQYWLSKNNGEHHTDGGFVGMDKVLWDAYVDGVKVVLSHASPSKEEGYPGDLLVRITFELTLQNEFKIDMEAFSTKPTIIDLSNLLYFNLGGHWSGPDQLYKHLVTINANCFTPYSDDGFPTGDIFNVIYSKFDYQSPKLLKDEISVLPDDGVNQNFCVNRGIDQDICFVARVLHPPSGRMLELYSNQPGVNFSTANDLGSGLPTRPVPIPPEPNTSSLDEVLLLVCKLHEYLKETKILENDLDYAELRGIIKKLKHLPPVASSETAFKDESAQTDLQLTPSQAQYLEAMETFIGTVQSDTDYSAIRDILGDILAKAEIVEEEENVIDGYCSSSSSSEKVLVTHGTSKTFSIPTSMNESTSTDSIATRILNAKRTPQEVPLFFRDGRIHGKNDAIYRRHGGFSLKSQNYPNAILHPNFPSCVLRPGEVYKHNIVYKFMLKGGNPRKWMKRNFPGEFRKIT